MKGVYSYVAGDASPGEEVSMDGQECFPGSLVATEDVVVVDWDQVLNQ